MILETAIGPGHQLCSDEVRMLRAVIAATACEAARFGHASSRFHHCQIRALRLGRHEVEYILRGTVSVELTVTRGAQLLSHEVGPVAAEAFDD